MSSNNELEENLKKEYFLKVPETKEELKHWISVYLDIDIPFGNVSQYTEDVQADIIYGSPGDAIWESFLAYKEDRYITHPGFIWLASRDGGKTLSGSILNVLLIVFFKAEIAHLAAVKKQAEKCIEYTNTFMRKIKPYLELYGRKIISDSKSKIQVLNEDGSLSYIDVIVASLAGANSQRSTVGSYDELDTLSRQGIVGYREAQLIPTRKNNHGPMTIKYSTRKFAGGFFEKEIEARAESGERLVQWNILDIVEKCTDERSQESSKEKHERYVKKQLPMKLYTSEDVDQMSPTEQGELKKIMLHKGCLKCPIAAVCQGHLTKKQDSDKPKNKSMYKSIDFAIGQFRKTSTEMAESQLLCWKPSSAGLVYPRFSHALGDNIISIDQAIEMATGELTANSSHDQLIDALKSVNAKFYTGVDFGFTNHSVIVVVAVLPNDRSLIVDCYSNPGLETHDFADIASTYQEKYGVSKWFCDNAAPQAIKTFKRKGMKCPDFRKDVQAGIDSIRSQILTSSGVRLLKVVKCELTEPVITMFKEHHFQLDAAGELTKNPDNEPGVADVGDSLRYLGQNLYAISPKKPLIGHNPDPLSSFKQAAKSDPATVQVSQAVNTEIMKNEILKRTQGLGAQTSQPKDPKKKIFWSMD